MKRLALFPMNRDQCAIARFASLLQGYQLTHCITPAYKKLDGADTSRLDGGDPTGFTLTSFDASLFEFCDTIYIDYDERMPDFDMYKEVIQAADLWDLDVILSQEIYNQYEQGIEEIAPDHQLEQPMVDTMSDIPVPVVMVLSQGNYTDQLATELALRKYFLDVGYNVSHISDRCVAPLFGATSYPHQLYQPRDAYEKTRLFNQFARDLVDKEDPELLIIGIPGAIGKYSNMQLQGLGMFPYIICNAVKSDASVLCMYQADYNVEFLDMLNQLTNYKLDSPTTIFSIANVTAQPDGQYNGQRLTYTDLDSQFVLEHLKNDVEAGDYVLYNALNSASAQQGGMAVQQALTDYAESIR